MNPAGCGLAYRVKNFSEVIPNPQKFRKSHNNNGNAAQLFGKQHQIILNIYTHKIFTRWPQTFAIIINNMMRFYHVIS